jgi:hypothetical protein
MIDTLAPVIPNSSYSQTVYTFYGFSRCLFYPPEFSWSGVHLLLIDAVVHFSTKQAHRMCIAMESWLSGDVTPANQQDRPKRPEMVQWIEIVE